MIANLCNLATKVIFLIHSAQFLFPIEIHAKFNVLIFLVKTYK
jgi:hypothetical protein